MKVECKVRERVDSKALDELIRIGVSEWRSEDFIVPIRREAEVGLFQFGKEIEERGAELAFEQ